MKRTSIFCLAFASGQLLLAQTPPRTWELVEQSQSPVAPATIITNLPLTVRGDGGLCLKELVVEEAAVACVWRKALPERGALRTNVFSRLRIHSASDGSDHRYVWDDRLMVSPRVFSHGAGSNFVAWLSPPDAVVIEEITDPLASEDALKKAFAKFVGDRKDIQGRHRIPIQRLTGSALEGVDAMLYFSATILDVNRDANGFPIVRLRGVNLRPEAEGGTYEFTYDGKDWHAVRVDKPAAK